MLNFLSVLSRAPLGCGQEKNVLVTTKMDGNIQVLQHSVAVLIAPSLFWIQGMAASPLTFQMVSTKHLAEASAITKAHIFYVHFLRHKSLAVLG